MPEFNLIDRPWIPCLLDSGASSQLGLLETIVRAREITEMVDASPVVTASLHRLVLSIIHRVLGPRDTGAWKSLWESGCFPARPISDYLERYRRRFDLFDAHRPFFQAASLDFQYERTINQLTHELVSGANPSTLFDHSVNSDISPAQAARYLVAFQSFAVGGLISLEKGQDPKLFKSADAAPLTKSAVAMVKGASLFQTLMLNLHQYSMVDEEPFHMNGQDVPAWERSDEVGAGDRVPDGYLDLLTWQSRRIRLHPVAGPDGSVSVSQVVIMKGNQFPAGWSPRGRETMVAYRRVLKPAAGQSPWVPVTFHEDRALWRDSLALMQPLDPDRERPKTINWLNDLVQEGILASSQLLNLDLLGLSVDRAKVFFWRHERLPLPLAYLQERELLGKLKDGLALTEEVGRLFQTGFDDSADGTRKVPRPYQLLASSLLSPVDPTKANKDAVGQLATHMAPGRFYWSRLEVPFQQFMVRLAGDIATDQDGAIEHGHHAMPEWSETLRLAALEAFHESINGMDSSARTLKARAQAESAFRRRLSAVLPRGISEEVEV